MKNSNHKADLSGPTSCAMETLSSTLQTHASLHDASQPALSPNNNTLSSAPTNPSNAIAMPPQPPCPNKPILTDSLGDDTLAFMPQPTSSASLQCHLRRQNHSTRKTHPDPHTQTLSSEPIDTVSEAICDAPSILPQELVAMNNVLIIDMRSLPDYKEAHVAHAINVNLPTLLIKRYRRGTVSNFNLGSFITTPQGTDQYHDWIQIRNASSPSKSTPSGPAIVVYDETMSNTDKTTNAWTLVSVLGKCLEEEATVAKGNHPSQRVTIYWLQGGFNAFRRWDPEGKHLRGAQFTRLPESLVPLSSQLAGRTELVAPTPTQSRSACTFHSSTAPGTNVQRRASLFSLDTSNVRNKANQTPCGSHKRLGRSRTTAHHAAGCELKSIHEQPRRSPTLLLPSNHLQLPMTGEITPATPATDKEYAFVVSEIVPDFLFLGPELSTVDQVKVLRTKSIRRILNMAEECDDDVPGLKDTFDYQKVAARDTVEMKHVDEMLQKAVHVINESKRHHDPIYVHCKAGKSRSVAAILAYLVQAEKWTLKRAYRHVIKARPSVSPNIGFVAELMKLEERVHGKVSNFAGADWHLVDLGMPPSPDSQREICKVQQAWTQSASSSPSPAATAK